MSHSMAIDVTGLVKSFGGFAAVNGLDLRVERGEVHGFLGPNGAGKSTTVRVLLGLYRATAGRVRVLDLDPARHAAEVTRRASYVPGDVNLWGSLTGQEVLDGLRGLRGAYDVAAERRLVDEFALDTHKKVRTYSKGNRQKVMLVAAFAARTELLVLDEPTSGLDPLMQEVYRRCVREAAAEGRTLVVSSHVLPEVEQLCDAVTIIKDGRCVESSRIADLRHLASSAVTANLTDTQWSAVSEGLRSMGRGDGLEPTPDLSLSVPREQVPAVLGLLSGVGAQDITCMPATLEDLFLRHYDVVAR